MSSSVTLKGNPVDVAGNLPKIGSKAPNFTLVDKALSDVTLETFAGKRKVLNIFPSVDTPTCAASIRAFNERAASLDNTVVLNVSADLPFAQNDGPILCSSFCPGLLSFIGRFNGGLRLSLAKPGHSANEIGRAHV